MLGRLGGGKQLLFVDVIYSRNVQVHVVRNVRVGRQVRVGELHLFECVNTKNTVSTLALIMGGKAVP